MNLITKILSRHLVSGRLAPNEPIAIHIEQTLTQDALGMLAYMAFERMGLPRIQTELSVSYTDHNLMYTDYRNPDDHAYQMSIAKRFGVTVSRAGNGICHSIHLARFAQPGKILIGTDSHTPSAGALGMLGIGAGGMDVALVMAGEPLTIKMPRVIEVRLTGRLAPGVNAKDAALVLLRRVGVKGGVGCAFEFTGEGAAALTVPERMTMTNLAVETGATTSVFSCDAMSLRYLSAQGRAGDWKRLEPDPDAQYDGRIDIDLSSIEPMVARPHQPDNVCPVREAGEVRVDQVFIGSCTNSSYTDLTRAAAVLEGRHVADNVSLIVSMGTRQNYLMLLKNGVVDVFVRAGARILECGCGPCVGMGQAVRTGGVSVRTVNRNFKGRCGTADSAVYLTGPETAAATAVRGVLSTAEGMVSEEVFASIAEPERYELDDVLLFHQEPDPQAPIVRGPNIGEVPLGEPVAQHIRAGVVIRLGDNVSTDEIAPSGTKNVSNRSNIPLVSRSAFERLDPEFWKRAEALGSSVIVAGENYGQGSSREHAALMPMYLGVKAVLAKSFARIHRSNLINFGLLPLVFENPEDYDGLHLNDVLEIETGELREGQNTIRIANRTTGAEHLALLHISAYERDVLHAGGVLRYIQQRKEGSP